MLEMKEVAHMIEGRLVDGGNVTRLVLGLISCPYWLLQYYDRDGSFNL